PSTDSWAVTSVSGPPTARSAHTAVWTGSEMIVWGGANKGVGFLNSGGRYNPSTDSWVATTLSGAPIARSHHTAVWTGSEMIVWGGSDGPDVTNNFNTGGRYCAQSAATPTPSPTPTPSATPSTVLGNISTRLRVEAGVNVLIGGFIVTGTQPKRVIVRAIGPSLPVAQALSDPILELRDSTGALIRSNDNWRSDQEQEILA